ncbi:unnamed protein product [Lactuca virosa]|uniref:Uncharacterized protein n=1 Tax=Lactuca virosa TaxID=75947 RepID=A0AAU9NTX2_9ASTR|nr:unnamed protein product [Lactuca virosa]
MGKRSKAYQNPKSGSQKSLIDVSDVLIVRPVTTAYVFLSRVRQSNFNLKGFFLKGGGSLNLLFPSQASTFQNQRGQLMEFGIVQVS